MLRRKLRTQQKMLHKKKRIIYNQRQEINRLRRGNKWEDATKDMSTIQKIFLEMLTTNLKCAPQDNRLHNKRANNSIAEERQKAHIFLNPAEHSFKEYVSTYVV
ncbi:uncharacterized protein LOC116853600 [Odontomachus brunneus]|uniref:uncharacterized protein LOC116853600 n=1 Tax=Odontomachus brunneus TaxID=486640 RepID=UPI0013F2A0E2|nr:uncharacterized protein LOC116853600 [Odontomachus brunneus]